MTDEEALSFYDKLVEYYGDKLADPIHYPILSFYDKLVEYYGDKLADPIHYPMVFSHQVKLYRYYNPKQQEVNNEQQN